MTERLPFHESIVAEMAIEHLDPTRAVGAANMVATTKCPKDRDKVREALTKMLDRFGGKDGQAFTADEREVIGRAFASLAEQDAEEEVKAGAAAGSLAEGSKVRLRPTSKASAELRQKVAELGDVVGEVGVMSRLGVCTVLLPPGVNVPGHSHPLGDGRDYIDLHKEHLEVV